MKNLKTKLLNLYEKQCCNSKNIFHIPDWIFCVIVFFVLVVIWFIAAIAFGCILFY